MQTKPTPPGPAERSGSGHLPKTSHDRKLAAGAKLRDPRRAKIMHASRPHGGWSRVPPDYLEVRTWASVSRRAQRRQRATCDQGRQVGEVCRCKNRLCPFCQKARSANIARQVHTLICSMKEPAHIVLTVKSDVGDLAPQIARLRTCFAKLRRSKLWRDNVTSGCYTVEVTINPKTGRWHPHLHVLADTPYIPQRLLRSAWHRITGDSHVVWIARVHNRDAAAWEISKYAGKPARIHELTNPQLLEFADAVHGQRMMQSFGKKPVGALHDVDATDTDKPDAFTISSGKLRQLAALGHKWPAAFAVLAAKRWPMFAPYFLQAAPQLAPYLDPATDPPSLQDLLCNQPPGRSPPPCPTPDTAQLDQALAECLRKIRDADTSGAYHSEPLRSHRRPVRLFGGNPLHSQGTYNDH